MTQEVITREHILDCALTLASKSGWESLQLQHVARHLGCSLAVINQHIQTKDHLADAWFDRADRLMLSQHYDSSNAAEHLKQAIATWLGSLSRYHDLTRQMLLYKLEPGHFHLQAAAILRISATVQWLREVANLQATGLARIGQELALSALFVGVFVYWLNDRSDGQQQTLQLLQHKLNAAAKLGLWR